MGGHCGRWRKQSEWRSTARLALTEAKLLRSGYQVSVLLPQLPDCPANMDASAVGETCALEAPKEVRQVVLPRLHA